MLISKVNHDFATLAKSFFYRYSIKVTQLFKKMAYLSISENG